MARNGQIWPKMAINREKGKKCITVAQEKRQFGYEISLMVRFLAKNQHRYSQEKILCSTKIGHDFMEYISTGAAGAPTHRSLEHHRLHQLILRLLVLCAPADFEVQNSLL